MEVNLHFEGGELRATEEEYDSEGGEVEEEDEERGGEYGGTNDGKNDIPPDMERVRAEGAGGLLKFWVKTGERVAHHADNDGCVVEDMGEEDEEER